MLIRKIEKIEIVICVALYAIMVVICFTNIVSRFALHFSFAFAEELELIAFIWSIMLGIAIGFNRGVHLGVGFITDMLKGIPKICAVVFSGVVSSAFMGFLFYEGVGMVQQQIITGLKTPALALPQWISGLAIPVGAVLIFISIVFCTYYQCREVLQMKKQGESCTDAAQKTGKEGD